MEHSPNATPNPGHYIYTDINNSLQFTRNNTPPNEATFILDNYGGNWASDGALKVICLRVFTNSGGTNLLQFYKNSTTPSTVFSMVETPTVTDALFIGGRNESSAFVTMDLASMEVYQKLTDSQVSKKITDLMNTYNTF
jgi:hypothetical protein